MEASLVLRHDCLCDGQQQALVREGFPVLGHDVLHGEGIVHTGLLTAWRIALIVRRVAALRSSQNRTGPPLRDEPCVLSNCSRADGDKRIVLGETRGTARVSAFRAASINGSRILAIGIRR